VTARLVQWAKATEKAGELITRAGSVSGDQRSGLKRDEDDTRDDTEGWVCYCSRVGWRYHHEDGRQIPAPDRVLLVFVNDEAVVYTHRWEPEDPRRAGYPVDWEDRFARQALG